MPTNKPVTSNTVPPVVDEPRPQIKQMLGGESDEDFAANLPDSTSGPVASEPKRKRRTKAEMDAARGQAGEVLPPVVDKRLEKARAKFASLGASKFIDAGFSTMGKPLTEEEKGDMDDYFYLVSSKGSIDPSQSWVVLIICGLVFLGQLIFTRTTLGDDIKKMLFPEKKEEEKEETPEAASEVPSFMQN